MQIKLMSTNKGQNSRVSRNLKDHLIQTSVSWIRTVIQVPDFSVCSLLLPEQTGLSNVGQGLYFFFREFLLSFCCGLGIACSRDIKQIDVVSTFQMLDIYLMRLTIDSPHFHRMKVVIRSLSLPYTWLQCMLPCLCQKLKKKKQLGYTSLICVGLAFYF